MPQAHRRGDDVKRIVILSGKGGTGKTTVAAALVHLAAQEASVVLADADVDAANLELVVSPQLEEHGTFTGGGVAIIDSELCVGCGKCADVCRFEAIVAGAEAHAVNEIGCEGCGACIHVCPTQAIHLESRPDGEWFHSRSHFGPLFHAHLYAGRENSGKLVTLVKTKAYDLALRTEADYLIVDGPPGTGCPVIAAVSGMDLALLVTEPTVSGAHDLQRIVGVTKHFHVPAVACINKWDLNSTQVERISAWCATQDVPVIGRIPFHPIVTEAMVQGQPVTAYSNGTVSDAVTALWTKLKQHVGERR
jgi:MinD superfamily P-loop ATPase